MRAPAVLGQTGRGGTRESASCRAAESVPIIGTMPRAAALRPSERTANACRPISAGPARIRSQLRSSQRHKFACDSSLEEARFEPSVPPSHRRGEAAPNRSASVLHPFNRHRAAARPTAQPAKRCRGSKGGDEQLSHKRAQEQASEAVNGGSKGQIELRRIAVEDRRGDLTTRASSILGRNRSGLRPIRSYDGRRPRWRSSAAAREFPHSTVRRTAAGRENAPHPHRRRFRRTALPKPRAERFGRLYRRETDNPCSGRERRSSFHPVTHPGTPAQPCRTRQVDSAGVGAGRADGWGSSQRAVRA